MTRGQTEIGSRMWVWIASIALVLSGMSASSVYAQIDPYQQGYDYFKNKQYTACAEKMEQAVEAAPEDFQRLYLLGYCYAKSGDWNAAVEPLKQATMVNEESLDALSLLANAYRRGPNDSYQAMLALEKAVSVAPDRMDLQLMLGVTALQLGKDSTAIQALETVVESKPDNMSAVKNLGLAYLRAKQFEKAEEMLSKVHAQQSDDCNVAHYLATAQRQTDQHEAALSTVEECAKKEGTEQQLFVAGSSAMLSKQYSKAVEYLEPLTEKAPDHYVAAGYLGQSYENLKEYDKALAAYQKALEKAKTKDLSSSELANYTYRVGHAHHLVKDYDKAIQFYDEALELNPGYEPAEHWKDKALERKKQQEMQR